MSKAHSQSNNILHDYLSFTGTIDAIKAYKEAASRICELNRSVKWTDAYNILMHDYTYQETMELLQKAYVPKINQSKAKKQLILDEKLHVEIEEFIAFLNKQFTWKQYQKAASKNLTDGQEELENTDPYTLHELSSGRFSYKHAGEIRIFGVTCGLVAWGCNNAGYMISFSGFGCQFIDPKDIHHYLNSKRATDGTHLCRLTRVDLAFDDLEGKYTVDWYKSQAAMGEFAITNNTKLSYSYIESGTIHPTSHKKVFDQSGGRSFYVGKRQNGKMFRCYEKGKQLQSEDNPNWVRAEVEIRNNKREIPFDILLNPDIYFTGAYPLLSKLEISKYSKPIKIIKAAKQKCSFEVMLKHAKNAYGKLIKYAIDIEQMTDWEVTTRLMEDIRFSDSFSRMYPARLQT